MVPEFASNVAHCDNILVSLIRLRPRVKLSTRTTHILCSHRLAHLVFKMWHVRTLDALVGEYQHLPKNTSDPFFKRTPWAFCVAYVQSTAYSCSMVYKPQFSLLWYLVWVSGSLRLAPARSGSA